MSDEMNKQDELLERFIDGELSAEERDRFEVMLAQDELLRERVELQMAIDSSLRRVFEPTEPKGVELSAAGAGRGRLVFARSVSRVVAAAAIVALSVGGAWYLSGLQLPSGGGAVASVGRTPSEVYAKYTDRDWEPGWVCENDEQFKDLFAEKFGREMLVAVTDGVAVIGWGYIGATLSQGTAELLVDVDGEKVLVLIDRAKNDHELEVGSDSTLHMFKRSAPGLVMYEVTPLEEARVLDLFYKP